MRVLRFLWILLRPVLLWPFGALYALLLLAALPFVWLSIAVLTAWEKSK